MIQPQAIRHPFQDIRRRPDGSIDIDFYRADAVALRNRAIRDILRLMALATVRVAVKQWRMPFGAAGERPLTCWFWGRRKDADVMRSAAITTQHQREKDPRGYDVQLSGFSASKSSHDSL